MITISVLGLITSIVAGVALGAVLGILIPTSHSRIQEAEAAGARAADLAIAQLRLELQEDRIAALGPRTNGEILASVEHKVDRVSRIVNEVTK